MVQSGSCVSQCQSNHKVLISKNFFFFNEAEKFENKMELSTYKNVL